ncbi:FkbM family methyltransferase [Hyphococcus formosus]|uniref:FkbM family methyltransferase n=1 Tax=Hyphococcus formosus TaxID=3143534 RepID=UPI00398B59E9
MKHALGLVADKAITDATNAILFGETSVDFVQLFDRTLLFVFEDDWLHAATPQDNRHLTRQEALKRISEGKAVDFGKYAGNGNAGDEKLLKRFCEVYDTFNLVDIGANYGRESVRYRALLTSEFFQDVSSALKSHVLVDPAHAGLLAPANLILHRFGDGIIVRGAMGDINGVERFYFKPNVTTGGTTLPNAQQLKEGRYKHVPVRIIMWDSLAENLNIEGPTFFKIDVQGAEPRVFDGARQYMQKYPCSGIFEFFPKAAAALRDQTEWLIQMNAQFDLWDVHMDRKRLNKIDDNFDLFIDEVNARDNPWTDLLFAPKGFYLI